MAINERTEARFRARASVFKALAHHSRLMIVDELSRHERCVRELTDMIGSDMSTVSKHLAVLKSAGIIADHRRGAQVYYRLKMACVMRFFECVGEVMEATAREHRDLVKIR